MKVARHIEVGRCRACPFGGPWANICEVDGRDLPCPDMSAPPDWCPLRSGPVTVELAAEEPERVDCHALPRDEP